MMRDAQEAVAAAEAAEALRLGLALVPFSFFSTTANAGRSVPGNCSVFLSWYPNCHETHLSINQRRNSITASQETTVRDHERVRNEFAPTN